MTVDRSRRFTDREVSIVLRRAAEIEEREGGGGAGGLSLDDLRQIAHEVGISADAIERAVGSLDRRSSIGSALAGAPLVRKAARAVPGELGDDAVARLVHVVDERAEQAGTVSEALGSVRWISSDRLRSTLVSITREAGETRVQVVEKTPPRIRALFHGLPTAWGAMLAAPVVGALGLGAAGMVGVIALGAVAGGVVGRLAWTSVSAQSARRVERLSAALAREAEDMAGNARSPAGSAENE